MVRGVGAVSLWIKPCGVLLPLRDAGFSAEDGDVNRCRKVLENVLVNGMTV